MGTFRFKSDLRNHQAIVQPRLYDSLMGTQITLRECSRGSLALADGPFPQRSIMRYARGGSRGGRS